MLHKVNESLHHIPKLAKDAGDTVSLGAITAYWIGMLTPFLEFISLLAVTGWFILRFIDLAWSLADKWKKRGGD